MANKRALQRELGLQGADVGRVDGAGLVQRLAAEQARGLARDDRRRDDAQHVPSVALARGAAARGDEVVPPAAHERAARHLKEVVPPVKVANGGDGVVEVAVGVALLQNVVALDAPRGAELAHARQRHHVAGEAVLPLELLEHLQLVLQEVAVDLVGIRAVVEGQALGVLFAVERGVAPGKVARRRADVARARGERAALQRDAQAHIGVEIAADRRGQPGAGHQVAVARRVDEHVRAVVGRAGLFLDHDAQHALAAARLLHGGAGEQRVKAQVHADFGAKARQLQREDLRRKARHVPRRELALRAVGSELLLRDAARNKVLRHAAIAVADGQAQELLRHAEDDLLAPAVAHGHKEVDESQGRKAPQLLRFLQQQNALARARRRDRRRNARKAAAGDQYVVVRALGHLFRKAHGCFASPKSYFLHESGLRLVYGENPPL